MKLGKFIGTVAAVTVGAAAGITAGAAIAAVVGFKKWSKDEDSDCVRIVLGNTRGIRLTKTGEADKYEIELNYDWQADPDFMDCENCAGCCEDCEGDGECNCCCVESDAEDEDAEDIDIQDKAEDILEEVKTVVEDIKEEIEE